MLEGRENTTRHLILNALQAGAIICAWVLLSHSIVSMFGESKEWTESRAYTANTSPKGNFAKGVLSRAVGTQKELTKAPSLEANFSLSEPVAEGRHREASIRSAVRGRRAAGIGYPIVRKTRPDKICYIHVGKAGGNSIWQGVKTLQNKGILKKVVQVHGNGDVKSDGTHDYFLHGGGFIGTNGKPVRSYGKCGRTGAVLLWVRDPVGRFISIWNWWIYQTRRIESKDLEEAVLSWSQGGEPLMTPGKGHAGMSTDQYLGRERCYNRSAYASLSLLFVGRTEHMQEDWNKFMDVLRLPHTGLAHSHSISHNTSKLLSNDSLSFLREQYKDEYQCIRQLIAEKWLPSSYYDEIMTASSYVYRRV